MTEAEFRIELEGLVKCCTELLMAFQRKEQLPRKFVASDWEDLAQLESGVVGVMSSCGRPGELFMEEWNSTQLAVQKDESKIDTRELKRRLKLLAQFQREYLGSTRSA